MAGALAERDFVEKLHRAGFHGVEVLRRGAVGMEQLALYPLFTDDLLALMRRLIPQDRHDRVATSIVVRAWR